MRTSRGFTLLELLVVVIIIGVLASLAIPRFIKTTEQARTAEAKQWLGQIRSSEIRYNLENGVYTTNLALLDIDDPNAAAQNPAYYTYTITVAPTGGTVTGCTGDISNEFTVTATRVSNRNRPGPPPGVTANYTINLSEDGNICGGP